MSDRINGMTFRLKAACNRRLFINTGGSKVSFKISFTIVTTLALVSSISHAQMGGVINQMTNGIVNSGMQAGANAAAGIMPDGIVDNYPTEQRVIINKAPTADEVAAAIRRQDHSERITRVKSAIFKQYSDEFNSK